MLSLTLWEWGWISVWILALITAATIAAVALCRLAALADAYKVLPRHAADDRTATHRVPPPQPWPRA